MEIVLSTFGTTLNVDNNAFVVTQGREQQRIPSDDVKSIQVVYKLLPPQKCHQGL